MERLPAYACVVVCCGLPGAGKTTLCRQISAFAAGRQSPSDPASTRQQREITVQHISLDAVEEEQREATFRGVNQEMLTFDPGLWQEARTQAFRRLQQALSSVTSSTAGNTDACQRQLLVLFDDNMYYRSMRHAAWRVARDCGAAYVTLHVSCDLELAMERNRGRQGLAVVPEDAMQRMASLLEVPQAGELGQPVLTFYSQGGHGHEQLCHGADRQRSVETGEVWAAILEAWGPPPSPPLLTQEEREALRTAGREANAASTAHLLDLRCRTAIGAALKDLGECNGTVKAEAAERLNERRKQVLATCRSALSATGAGSDASTTSWVDDLEAAEAELAELCSEVRNAAFGDQGRFAGL